MEECCPLTPIVFPGWKALGQGLPWWSIQMGLQLNQITSYGDEVHRCKSHPRHPGLIPPKEEIDIWIRENERVRCGGGSLVD